MFFFLFDNTVNLFGNVTNSTFSSQQATEDPVVVIEYYIPKHLRVIQDVSTASNESVPFPVQPQLRMYDVYDRWAQHLGSESADWTVTASLVPGKGDSNAKLSGESTVKFVNGTASFKDLQITHAGTGYQLKFHVSYPEYVSFTVTGQNLINIGHRELAFRYESNIVDAVEMFEFNPQPRAFVYDVATGKDVTSLGAKGEEWSMEASLVSSNSAILMGTTSIKFNETMALFNDLTINKAGTGYQIILTGKTEPAGPYISKTTHTSETFNVGERSYHLQLTSQPGDCNDTIACGSQPIVEVRSGDQVASHLNWDSKQWHVEATLCQPANNNPLKGTTKLAVPQSGIVEFTDLYFENIGSNYKLCFQLIVTPTEEKYSSIITESNAFSVKQRLFYLKIKVQPGNFNDVI